MQLTSTFRSRFPGGAAGAGRARADADAFSYHGADLESMDLAERYHDWIRDWFAPYVGKNLVEVGAGTGGFARRMAAAARPERMLLIEPSATQAEALRASLVDLGGPVQARVHHGFLADAAHVVREVRPDTFIYVNVLEHVEHDVAELRQVYELLPPGGYLCVFVPAMPFLYSEFDRSVGHFRRYRLAELRAKARSAGFDITLARHLDLLGVLPWLVAFRWLRATRLSRRGVAMYDRFVVPVVSRLERLVRPPVGKNIVLVARKPHTHPRRREASRPQLRVRRARADAGPQAVAAFS